MLRKMRLLNFKSWRELDLDLAPLTILFGTNSSGKTSILQALLLLKQTVASFDRKQHINFGSRHDYVDLGSYRDLAFGHDENQTVSVGLEWIPLRGTVEVTVGFNEGNRFTKLYKHRDFPLIYDVRWRYLDDEIAIEALQYNALVPDELDVLVQAIRRGDGDYDYRFPLLGTNLQSTESPDSCYVIPPLAQETTGGKPTDIILSPINYSLLFENLIDRILYLGPLRNRPERYYPWTGTGPQEIEPTGQNAVGMLIASKRKSPNGQNLLELVAGWLTKLGLVSGFQIETVDRDKRLYEPQVKVTSEGIASSLLDAGFGISQVLPVVTLLLSAPEGSIVLVEQPELHLHPSAQANLADLFLDVAEKRHLQLIIESHSEHLLARLQRRIAESENAFAKPDNIKMYFCQTKADGSTVQRVEVDEYGQIANWPDKFFGDKAGDLDAMMDAAIERRRRELSSGD